MSIVLIVGAGASSEFGLPIGSGLSQEIVSLASFGLDTLGNFRSGDREAFGIAQHLAHLHEQGQWHREIDAFRSNLPLALSIDNFLHAHQDRPFRVALGKSYLVKTLLDAERNSTLYFEPRNIYDRFNFAQTSRTWLGRLFQILSSAGNIDDFRVRLREITFVTFNYDRVIERFIYLALRGYFELSSPVAEEIIFEDLDIYHVYGSLGDLNYDYVESDFGGSNRTTFWERVENIKTFSEGANQATSSIIRQKIMESEALFFLGFSFLGINMDLLEPSRPMGRFENVFGTTMGVSPYNEKAARARVEGWMLNPPAQFYFEGIGCSELIGAYSAYF